MCVLCCVCVCVCVCVLCFFLSGRRRHPSNPPKSLFTLATSGDFKTLILECFVFSHRNKKLLSERVCVCVCVCVCVGPDTTRKQRLQRWGIPRGQIKLPACPFTHKNVAALQPSTLSSLKHTHDACTTFSFVCVCVF